MITEIEVDGIASRKGRDSYARQMFQLKVDVTPEPNWTWRAHRSDFGNFNMLKDDPIWADLEWDPTITF